MKSPKLVALQYNYTLRKDDILTVYNDDFSEYKTFTSSGLLSSATFFPDVELPGIDYGAHITQHFFNSDDKLEMIVGGNGFYAVINEDGNELCRFVSDLYANIKLAEIGSNKYIIVKSDNNDNMEIFRLDTEVNATESIALSKISAFPNPATDHVTFTFNLIDTSGTLQVSDLSGRTVLQQTIPGGSQSSTIETRTLSPGTYIARLISEGKEIAKEKLIVK